MHTAEAARLTVKQHERCGRFNEAAACTPRKPLTIVDAVRDLFGASMRPRHAHRGSLRSMNNACRGDELQ